MLRSRTFYPVLLAALLTLAFIVGNPHPSGDFGLFPWVAALLLFPAISFQMKQAIIHFPSSSAGQLFRLCEWTVFWGSVLLGLFAILYSYFFFRQPGASIPVGMLLLRSALSAFLVGTLFAGICAWVFSRVARRHEV